MDSPQRWSQVDIAWFVNRQHVATTDDELTAALRRRMPAGKGWTNADRAEAIAYALKLHEANRWTYTAVLSGHLSHPFPVEA